MKADQTKTDAAQALREDGLPEELIRVNETPARKAKREASAKKHAERIHKEQAEKKDESTEVRATQAAQTAAKKAKAKGRVSKMLAKKSGETKKMPASGKDAVAVIRATTTEWNGPGVAPGKTKKSPKAAKTTEVEPINGPLAVAEPAMAKAIPAKAKAAKAAAGGPRKPGVGAVAMEAILAGATNEEALKKVMKAFPNCSSNLSCMSWYRGKLAKEGKLRPTKAA